MAFNVGDYVEVVDTGRVAFGESGDIVEIIPAYSGHSSVQTYRVRLNDGVEMDFVSSDLAIAERSEPAFKLVERISQLQATIDRLQAENARLRDALAPFAENWRGYREYLSMDIGTKTLTEWLDWAVDQSTLRTDFANAEQIDATPPIEGEVP